MNMTHKVTVLIIEDEKKILTFVSKILKKMCIRDRPDRAHQDYLYPPVLIQRSSCSLPRHNTTLLHEGRNVPPKDTP